MNTKYNSNSLITFGFHIIYAICLPLLILIAVNTWADQGSQGSHSTKIQAVKTKIIHGFCIGLAGWNGDFFTNNTSVDDRLVFLPWTTNESSFGYNTRIVVPVEPQYAYQVELFDTNGVILPKTELGKTIGTKFFDFNANAYQKGIAIRHLTTRILGETTEAPLLFRPSDLFKIQRPGYYTLQVRFQILTFPRTGPNRHDYTNDLIRFPPLDYPLVQLAGQTNLPSK